MNLSQGSNLSFEFTSKDKYVDYHVHLIFFSFVSASKKKRVVVSKAQKRTRANSQLQSSDPGSGRLRTFSGSSGEVFATHGQSTALPLNKTARGRTLSSTGSDAVIEKTKRGRRSLLSSSSISFEETPSPRERSSTNESITGGRKGKRKGTRKRLSSQDTLETKDKPTKKKGFSFRPSFGLGRSKTKSKESKEKESGTTGSAEPATKQPRRNNAVSRSGRGQNSPRGHFSRNQPSRKSARDIIRELEAKAKPQGEAVPTKEASDVMTVGNQRSIFSKKSLSTRDLVRETEKRDPVKLLGVKRMNAVEDPKVTPAKQTKRGNLLDEIAR